jgi:hypothetical protein
MLIALSMILMAIADSGFGYMAVSNMNSATTRLDMEYPKQYRIFVYSVYANMV